MVRPFTLAARHRVTASAERRSVRRDIMGCPTVCARPADGEPPCSADEQPAGQRGWHVGNGHRRASRDEAADLPARTSMQRSGGNEKTRRAILAATVSLFDRLDYGSITMDAVARAAGFSRATIYRHWPSRQLLVLEAYTAKMSDALAAPDTGDAIEDLRTSLAQMAFCLDFGGAASTVSGIIVDAIADPEFSRLYRRVMLRERREVFGSILARGQERGQIRRDIDLDVAVDAIYGAVHHRLLVSRQIIDGPFMKALVDVTMNGLAAHPTSPGGSSSAPHAP